ncbi:hypothetical protein BDW62DRAFT_199695 [Aspergillus aurantiobrunneus]
MLSAVRPWEGSIKASSCRRSLTTTPLLETSQSRRGVVFFNDKGLGPSELRLIQRVGQVMDHPQEASFYRSTISAKKDAHLGIVEQDDPEILIISSESQKESFPDSLPGATRKFASWGWHSDESQDKYPPAYSGSKIAKSPPTGGDMLFVSSYGLYDHLSEPWQKFAESLTATHFAEEYFMIRDSGVPFEDWARGQPENIGFEFKESHPVVRTNPVTGWKGLFGEGFGLVNGWYDNMTEHESNLVKQYFLDVIAHSSDLQIRRSWRDNGAAIWNNAAVHHNPTYDVVEGERLIPCHWHWREALFRPEVHQHGRVSSRVSTKMAVKLCFTSAALLPSRTSKAST